MELQNAAKNGNQKQAVQETLKKTVCSNV